MTVKDIIERINTSTAETLINGFEEEAKLPEEGGTVDYTDYDTDRDLVLKFRRFLNVSDEKINKLNTYLNRSAAEYEDTKTICPSCGRALDQVGNDGNFCKFCGQQILRPVNTTLGENIKRLRTGTQAEVAKEVGFSVSRMCLIEKDVKIPTVDELKAIAAFHKCSVNELFGQPAPRNKPAVFMEHLYSYQQYDRPTMEPLEPVKKEDLEGYDNEYIYTCPFCGEEVDLTAMESLSVDLSAFSLMRERTTGNDGAFCKHCGQAIRRPVEINEKKAFKTYSFWIREALQKRL